MDLEEKLKDAMDFIIKERRHQLEIFAEKLNGLSPLNKLNSGYAYITRQDKAIRSIDEIEKGERFHVYLKDGGLTACVEEKFERGGS